jgi:hypothetical protein
MDGCEAAMDSSAIPVFLAGPFPVVYTANLETCENHVELDVALLIAGLPNILASTMFPLDGTWERIKLALDSGDARLGVAGMPHEEESTEGGGDTDREADPEVFPSAYIGLECANGERLVLAHIRGLDPAQEPEVYAREVIDALLQGCAPDDLGVTIDD